MMTATDRQQQIFRFATSVTLAAVSAMVVSWPLGYIAPLLVVNILSKSHQPPNLKSSLLMVVVISLGMLTGLVFSALFLPQPLLACLLLALIFFWIYWLSNRGKLPAFAGITLLLGMTLIPMMTIIDPKAANLIAFSLIYAAMAALLFVHCGFLLFPAPKSEPSSTTLPKLNPSMALQRSLISTLAIWPAMLFFITFEWSGGTLIIAFIAILSLNPALEDTRKAGLGLLVGNVLGGLLAMLFFLWMSMSPHFSVYIASIAVVSLWLSTKANSDQKFAPLWTMALSTLLLLTGSIMSGSGGEAEAKFITRILQIAVVAVYMVLSVNLLTGLFNRYQKPATI